MSNFTQIIKREILNRFPESECCRRSSFCAMIAAGGNASSARVEFASENERIAEYYFSLAESLGLLPRLDGARYDARSGKDRVRFVLNEEGAARANKIIQDTFVPSLKGCCAVSYVCGAFLGCGSCSLPYDGAKSGYHLEFAFSDEERAEIFCDLLESMLFYTRMIRRCDKFVVYLKSREAVSDFLSVIGVSTAQREFEQISSARDQSNLINRVENCMAGNADKSMTASAEQVRKIQSFKERGGFPSLSEPLRELAEERLCNPTLSLRELALKTGVSKSCLNHRMRKLLEICGRGEERS